MGRVQSEGHVFSVTNMDSMFFFSTSFNSDVLVVLCWLCCAGCAGLIVLGWLCCYAVLVVLCWLCCASYAGLVVLGLSCCAGCAVLVVLC